MGLKNISDKNVNLRYNGTEVVLKPGESVDVRDFNITNSEVFSVEENLLEKHIDTNPERYGVKFLAKVKTLSNMSDAQINAEIKNLQEVIAELKAESEPREKELVEAATQVADLSGKLDVANKKIEEMEALLDEATPNWRKKKAKAA